DGTGDGGAARGSTGQVGEVSGRRRAHQQPYDHHADVSTRGRDQHAQHATGQPGHRDRRGDGGQGEQRDARQGGEEIGTGRGHVDGAAPHRVDSGGEPGEAGGPFERGGAPG